MKITQDILDDLTAKAKESPRLRMNLDLCDSAEDTSQRMLNAIEPGAPYGPAGRPDMAYFGFTNKLLKGETIQIFNYGNCRRDFTYVDDIVEGVYRVMQKAPERKKGENGFGVDVRGACGSKLK